MNLKQFLTFMLIGTALSWAMFLLVILKMEPSGSLAIMMFYISLFLALMGSLSIIGLTIRVIFLKRNVIFKEVKNSFRQAILLSFLLIAVLFLQSKRLLSLWNMVFLVIALTALESFLSSLRTKWV